MKSFLPDTVLSAEQSKLRTYSNRANHLLSELNKLTQEAFDFVWSDPAANFAAQGTKAETNIIDHARTVTYLLANGFDVPQQYRSAPQAYTVQNDGSITID
jgi:hypothetical protein